MSLNLRGNWLRRLLPLCYLLPLAYLTWPIFWSPIDDRFYNYFHSKRSVPPWTEVVVVGIDRETRAELFGPPVYPLSRHVERHAELTRLLDEAGARAIVFDLALGTDTFDDAPDELVEAFRTSGRVHLVMSFQEERAAAESGETAVLLAAHLPDPMLVEAAEGAFVADVRTDPDGVVRRFGADEHLARLGVETIPGRLAGFDLKGTVPIEFPSVREPLPVISYIDVVRDFEGVAPLLKNRIVFVGLVEDPWRDFVSVPRLQKQGQGVDVFGLHGVVVLAAITETLLRGAPIRDAGPVATLAWTLFWCLLAVSILPRRHPTKAAMTVAGLIAVAIVVTGVLHVRANIIFPAGFVFGALFLCGTQALISSYVETTKALNAEEMENERTRQEMLMARRAQETFLPSEIPVVEGVGVWGINVSSLTVSGDYYDVVDLGEDGPLVVVIADVSGKGLAASLIMSNVQAGLHSHMLQERFELKRAAENLNRLVHANTEAGKFVTLFVAEYNKSTRELRYVRAGHDEPIVSSADGTVRKIEDGGFVLGFMPDVEYDVGAMGLVDGDVLCLYTDGVTEARSPEGEEFGIERLTDTVRKNRERQAPEVGGAILSAVREFTQIEQQADDVTLVVLKVEGSSA